MEHVKDVPILCKTCGKEICKSQDMKKAKMLKLIPLKAQDSWSLISVQYMSGGTVSFATCNWLCLLFLWSWVSYFD